MADTYLTAVDDSQRRGSKGEGRRRPESELGVHGERRKEKRMLSQRRLLQPDGRHEKRGNIKKRTPDLRERKSHDLHME